MKKALSIVLEDEDLQVIQVCDAKNLRRGLMITLQLLVPSSALGLPFQCAPLGFCVPRPICWREKMSVR